MVGSIPEARTWATTQLIRRFDSANQGFLFSTRKVTSKGEPAVTSSDA